MSRTVVLGYLRTTTLLSFLSVRYVLRNGSNKTTVDVTGVVVVRVLVLSETGGKMVVNPQGELVRARRHGVCRDGCEYGLCTEEETPADGRHFIVSGVWGPTFDEGKTSLSTTCLGT